MPAPTVTVIIATYNWSDALRVSAASALAQTWRDFELLVIGDACTDDSEQAALSFGDPRVRWHNLPARHKSQSGPNNYGIAIAAGSLIAYLGHDDVWHPEHLASLVAAITESGADLACSVAASYGPPGSGMRGISGLFVENRQQREDFVPPSSLMHRCSLTDKIGPWKAPEQVALPVDSELLRRAWDAGSRIAPTSQLTVFKFNSAWRRDSYLRRDTTEQQAMLARLQADPAKCVAEEWAGLLRAMREHRLIEYTMPPDAAAVSGNYYRAYMRMRGLEVDAVSELTGPMTFTLEDQSPGLEWYGVEYYQGWGPFRWSGPSPRSVVVLPVQTPARFRVRIHLLNWWHCDIAAEVTLSIADRPVSFTCTGDGLPLLLLETTVDLPSPPQGALRIAFQVKNLICPIMRTDVTTQDTRWLGVCIASIELEPA